MKYPILALTIVTLSFLSAHSSAQNLQVNWHLNLEEAMKDAKETKHSILISFAGSDWCKPCIKLTREVFEDAKFQKFALNHLELVLADFPRLKKNQLNKEQVIINENLAEKYNQNGEFPLVVLLDFEGNLLGTVGYRAGGAEQYIQYLQSHFLN